MDMAKYGSRRSQQPENVNLKSFTILNKLSSTRSSASTSATSRSFELVSSKARVTSVKSSVQSVRTCQETCSLEGCQSIRYYSWLGSSQSALPEIFHLHLCQRPFLIIVLILHTFPTLRRLLIRSERRVPTQERRLTSWSLLLLPRFPGSSQVYTYILFILEILRQISFRYCIFFIGYVAL